MNSRERVLAALGGRIPDRVPVAEFAVDFDTVEKVIGHETHLRAKARSRIAFWEGRHEEVAQSWLADHIELHEKLDLDIVSFPSATCQVPPETDDPPPRKVDETTWEDRYGRVYRYSEVTADITCVRDPVAAERVFRGEDFQGDPGPPEPPDPGSPTRRIINAVIDRFRGEKFICGPSGGEIGMTLLGGMERGLMELVTNPEAVRAATAYNLRRQNLADEVVLHPDADGVIWGGDFGYKTGPFISPEMFRDLFLDANRRRVASLHRLGRKVLKHCCGNNNELMDMFLEIGYDAYQSIQPTAGMDICGIKKQYGDRITLWGGVAVENMMAGTPEDVRRDVRRAMGCAKPGGRFILGTSHSIAVGSRYENFMAMLDEHAKLCDY